MDKEFLNKFQEALSSINYDLMLLFDAIEEHLKKEDLDDDLPF